MYRSLSQTPDQFDNFLQLFDELLQDIFKLNLNPTTSAKTHWPILKTFANGRKVPVIFPLLINNEFISNFKTKANYFKRFFNQQCTAISTDSSIPSSVNLATNEAVTTVNFDEQLISKLIVALNPNKAQGHDGLSIRMVQMDSESISKPLSIIFRNCLKAGYFLTVWKKSNVAPVHKEGNKQILSNYRPISLLLFVANFLKKSFLMQFFNT